MIHRHIRSNLFCYVLLKCLYIPFLTLFPKLMKHYKQKAQFEPQRKQSNARLKIQRRQKVNMTHQNRKNSLWRTHNVKDESTKHECVAETKTQLALQFKQSKSKIFLRRDKVWKMMKQKNLSCRERKPKLSCNSSDQNLWSKS